MPIYDYHCAWCEKEEERMVAVEDRDSQWCPSCGCKLFRLPAAPMGRMAGVIPQGGGPDKFTADMLGVPLKDLPPGLKTK
jgi:putative FmdB family regulatory protein